MDSSLISTGKALLNLSADESALVSTAVIKRLSERNTTLTVTAPGATFAFAPGSLLVEQISQWSAGQAQLEIRVEQVKGVAFDTLLAQTPAISRAGSFSSPASTYDLTAILRTTAADGSPLTKPIHMFAAPIAVTLNLSALGELTPEQAAQLRAVYLENDEGGALAVETLAGAYNSTHKTFTLEAPKTGRLTVMSVIQPKLIMDLVINRRSAAVNGQSKPLDVAPVLVNGRTMVPVRFIAETLGAVVNWCEDTKTVSITLGGTELKLVVGQVLPAAGLDVPAQIIKGRTLVPLRYVSENLGATVNWYDGTSSVEIILFD